MEFPSWFQNAIQQRLDRVSAQIDRNPELNKYHVEENLAFDAMLTDLDKTRSPEFMDWEDKHHLKLAMEQEQLYLQGMRDGMQLVFALLSDPISSDDGRLAKAKTEPNPVKADNNG